MEISILSELGDNCVIERQVLKGIPFNTVINVPDNCKVVYYDGETKRVLEGNRILNENMIENRKKKKNKVVFDDKTYTVYFFSNAPIKGKFGTNIKLSDGEYGNITRKINIRGRFEVKIVDLLKFSERVNQDVCDKDYVCEQINDMICGQVKELISRSLKSCNLENFQGRWSDCEMDLLESLNKEGDEAKLLAVGCKLIAINFETIEEEQNHENKRNKIKSGRFWKNEVKFN